MNSKQCAGECQLFKPATPEFFPLTDQGNLRAKCKECRNKERRELWGKNTRHKKYNMSPDGYNQLMQAQNYACAICGATNKILVMDHCHQTSVLRGAICNSCNLAIGLFKDSPEYLQNAIEYLTKAKNGKTA